MFNNIYEIVIIAIDRTPICPLKPRKSRLDKRINKIAPIKKLEIKCNLYLIHKNKTAVIITIKITISEKFIIILFKLYYNNFHSYSSNLHHSLREIPCSVIILSETNYI